VFTVELTIAVEFTFSIAVSRNSNVCVVVVAEIVAFTAALAE
jgi:hypothetical protein